MIHTSKAGVISMPDVILYTEDLTKRYKNTGYFLKRSDLDLSAVNSVSLSIFRGETLGLVGESGCGKSTLGRMLVRLLDPTSGRIFFNGADITFLSGPELKKFRQKAQIIFQDPLSSLNPRMRIHQLVSEPLIIHESLSKEQLKLKTEALLDMVGLGRIDASAYPHRLSGGQLQRVGIARALSVDPDFLVCDEPVSALDVSIQSQIINLLSELQKELGLTCLFISHNLAAVRNICDRIAVMYLGEIVELSESEAFFKEPLHPYSRMLLESVPNPNPRIRRSRSSVVGEASDSAVKTAGCSFYPRCPLGADICSVSAPELKAAGSSRSAACHMVNNK